jgi:hypothetical protein
MKLSEITKYKPLQESLNIDLHHAYELFSKTYQKSTGSAWTYQKFMSRARNWEFLGDEFGYVAFRRQRSGMVKLVGVAGNIRSIRNGVIELLEQNHPTWGMISKNMVPMAVKLGFINPPAFLMKIMLKMIPKSVFGDVDFDINNDGSITLKYSDVGDATKYFIANKEYFKHMLVEMKDKSSDLAMKPVIKFIEMLVK